MSILIRSKKDRSQQVLNAAAGVESSLTEKFRSALIGASHPSFLGRHLCKVAPGMASLSNEALLQTALAWARRTYELKEGDKYHWFYLITTATILVSLSTEITARRLVLPKLVVDALDRVAEAELPFGAGVVHQSCVENLARVGGDL